MRTAMKVICVKLEIASLLSVAIVLVVSSDARGQTRPDKLRIG
jgi:hypothetical protein